MFSTESSRFTSMTNSPIDLAFSTSASLGGKVYCLAELGRAFLCLTPEAYNGKGAWMKVAPFPHREPIKAAAAFNGCMYAASGSHMVRYSPASDTWEPVASMIRVRGRFTLVPNGGYLYAVEGGRWLGDRFMERYDPVTNTWEAVVTSKDHLHEEVAAAAMGGLLYVAGGYGHASVVQSECFCFNPSTVSWRKIANLPEPRWSVALSCLRGELYAMGGLGADDDEGPSSCPIWRYKPMQDVWEDVPLSEGSATLTIDDNCSWCAM